MSSAEKTKLPRKRKLLLKTLLPALLFFILDRIIKNFSFGTGLATLNRGVAFGSFPQIGLVLSAVGFLLLILAQAHHRFSYSRFGFFLVIFGALSNLLDRFTYGGVVDYILISSFLPSFNLSDVMIVVGVGAMVWGNIRS